MRYKITQISRREMVFTPREEASKEVLGFSPCRRMSDLYAGVVVGVEDNIRLKFSGAGAAEMEVLCSLSRCGFLR